MKQNISYDGKE